jgi:hypothetical protein
MANEITKLNLTPEEINLIINGLESIIGFLISKTDITPEDKAKLISLQDTLNQLRSKEQQIADGKL